MDNRGITVKLLIFSDIHGNQYALFSFLNSIKGEKYDLAVFCGDIFGYYYGQRDVFDTLKSWNELIWIKGNHDQYFIDMYTNKSLEYDLIQKYGHSYCQNLDKFTASEIEEISNLKSGYDLFIDGKRIGIFHGTPDNPLEGRLYPKDIPDPKKYGRYDYVILGHTHCRLNRDIGKTKVINSGSLGQPRDGNGFGYCILDTVTSDVTFYNVDIDMLGLYHDIDLYDANLIKLKSVLERNRDQFK